MAAAFAAGGLIPFATWLLLPALGAWDFYRGGTMLRPLAVFVLACAAGGALAGGALGRNPRWRAAFGTAFVATLWIPFLMLTSLPALSGRERLIDLLVGFAPALALSHALLGAFGLVLGGSGWRRACTGAMVFGAAGAGAGVLLALVVRLLAGLSGAPAFALSALGGGATCLVPLTVAGWWLARPTATTARRPPARARCGR